jgi:MtrB/PioB family decaheme-associated outer membrane protein
MRLPILSVLMLSCGALALPEEPAAPSQPTLQEDYSRGEVNLGLVQSDEDTISSKFLEYRDIPNGVTGPYFRFDGRKGDFHYDVWGRNIQQRDQRYFVLLGNDTFKLTGDYNQIPHRFGNEGKTLLQETGEGVWQMSDTLQRTFQTTLQSVPSSAINYNFLNAMVSPSLAAANRVDLVMQRERGNFAFNLKPGEALDVRVAYFRERRVGDRAASGTAFGFGNVVELPETLHYLTQDVGADAQYAASWGSVRGGLHFNWFRNRVGAFDWDNPFRVTDSTDPSAYQAPGSQSINGPSHGLMALPPDNDAFTANAGASFKLPSRTRVSVDVALGRWTQDSAAFIPYTTNTAIVGEDENGATFPATDPGRLPARALDGQINTTSLSASLSSRPLDKLSFTARFRSFDRTNDTGRIAFPGYVRFDAVWEEIPRISVPYAYKNNRFDATVGYDLHPVILEGGYRHTGLDRSFRETEHTSEDAWNLAAVVRGGDWAHLRASYERAQRDYEGLEIELSEEASFQSPGSPANVLAIPPPSENPAFAATYASLCGSGPVCNLRYDQAVKDSDRIGATLDLSPGSGKLGVSLGYVRTKDDYKETRYGLTEASYDSVSAQLDFSPTERASLWVFYNYEKLVNAQRGRQSGSTVSANPLDDWTSDVNDKTDTFGGGADITLKPDKWFLKLWGQYQKMDGMNDLFAAPGGAPANARTAVGGVQDIPLYDDTKLSTVLAEVKYQFAKAWALTLGGFFEDYEIQDSNTKGLANYVPGSFFLAAVDDDYQATVVYLKLTYNW